MKEIMESRAKQIALARSEKPPRPKATRTLAVINQAGCTGCEACIVFCPVDCIEIVPGIGPAYNQQVVEVDPERCIGCALCAKHCPWDTIPMFPHDEGISMIQELTLKSVCGQPTSGL